MISTTTDTGTPTTASHCVTDSLRVRQLLVQMNSALDDWLITEVDAEDIHSDSSEEFVPLTPDECENLPNRT